MQTSTIELMRDQAFAIYRAITGTELSESELDAAPSTEESQVGLEEVTRRFADMEELARQIPAVAERVPAFSFDPPMDVLETSKEILLELAVPGVDKADVSVTKVDGHLVIKGIRSGERAANGKTYLHAEIPRGLFQRTFQVPVGVSAEANVQIENGLIVIRLSKSPEVPAASE